jgi:hypothetical protein
MSERLFASIIGAVTIGCCAVPAAAQGVFNMGGPTQTLTIPTAPAEARNARDRGTFRQALRPRPKAAAPVQVSRFGAAFRRDAVLTMQLERRYIQRFNDPKLRAEVTRNLRGVTPKFMAAMRAVGLDCNNVADAQAAYIVTVWQATRGDYRDNPAQFQAVARQMAVGFSKAGLDGVSNATKQEMAETVIYDAMFIAGLFKDAKSDPALKRWVANYAARGLKTHFGLDTKTLRMTSAGLQA